ncbi:MAG: hydrolase, partial [Chloroflexota bacterium]
AHLIGRLHEGYLADIILIRLDAPHLQPIHHLGATVVYAARASDVDTVIIHGKLVMEGRRLLTLDLPAILNEAQARAGRLADRGHGRRIQTYRTGAAEMRE